MIDINEIIRQMTANAQAIRTSLSAISPEQAQWQPDPKTWSLAKVMEHVYNEERMDFRKHLKEMFSTPPLPWAPWSEAEYLPLLDLPEALQRFLAEREDSLAYLRTLAGADWERSSTATFGKNKKITLRAGDVLFSWLEHDYLHMRQVNELRHAWNVRQAAPYQVDYAGGW